MSRLDVVQIGQILQKFITATTDEQKQSAVDSLGLHPINHAQFGKQFAEFYKGDHWTERYEWREYLRLTAQIKVN